MNLYIVSQQQLLLVDSPIGSSRVVSRLPSPSSCDMAIECLSTGGPVNGNPNKIVLSSWYISESLFFCQSPSVPVKEQRVDGISCCGGGGG